MKIKYSRFEIINGTLYYGFIIITLMYISVLLDWESFSTIQNEQQEIE